MRPERFPTCQCVTCMYQRETANRSKMCTRCLDQGHKRCDRHKRLERIGTEDPHAYHGHRSVVNEEKFGLKTRDE